MRLYYVKDSLAELETAVHLLVISNIHPWDDQGLVLISI